MSIDKNKRSHEANELPLVTVITPTFDRAAHLKETARSILAQDYPRIEYIIVDDGSTDETELVVHELPQIPGKTVRYVRQANAGESKAVNRGWRIAGGEFVAIVGSDDPQPATWLNRCVPYLIDNPDKIVGYPDWVIIGERGEELYQVQVPEFSWQLLVGDLNCLPGPGSIIRRSLVSSGELRRAELSHCSDFESWLRLSLDGAFLHIPLCVAQWREHTESKSVKNHSVWMGEMRWILDDFFQRKNLPQEMQRLRRRALGNLHYQAARLIWRHSLVRAVVHFLRAIVLLVPLGRFPMTHAVSALLGIARRRSAIE